MTDNSQSKFYNTMYKKNELISADNTIKDPFMKRFLELLNIKENSRILEIGCGNGSFTVDLLKTKIQLDAVDISEEAIINIKKRFEQEYKEKQFNPFCHDIIKFLENTNEKYDCIVGSGIIHHINKEDLDRLFKLIYSRLKEGGIFACAPEPNVNGIYYYYWKAAPFIYNKIYRIPYDKEVEKGTFNMKTKKIMEKMKHAGFTFPKALAYQVLPHFSLKALADVDRKLVQFISGHYSLYTILFAKK